MSLIKSAYHIANIRESGKYLTELLGIVQHAVAPGVSLMELEHLADKYIRTHKLQWAFKGYDGFPANLCLSVNDCVVHGIPDEYILQTGDFLKIDCGIIYQKGISDAAISVVVWGELANPQAYALAQATKLALDKWVDYIVPGASLNMYGQAVWDEVRAHGFTVLKNLTGHGVGTTVHEKPYIYNYPNTKSKRQRFESGMVVALEPITALTSETSIDKEDIPWNLYTADGDIGAHWEYTVVVSDNGPEILAGIQ